MTPGEIEKKYNSLINRENKIRQQIKDFKAAVKDICHHPKEFHYIWHDDVDNGYGKWWKVENTVCSICGKRKLSGYGSNVWGNE